MKIRLESHGGTFLLSHELPRWVGDPPPAATRAGQVFVLHSYREPGKLPAKAVYRLVDVLRIGDDEPGANRPGPPPAPAPAPLPTESLGSGGAEADR